jgi:hypothetical protein
LSDDAPAVPAVPAEDPVPVCAIAAEPPSSARSAIAGINFVLIDFRILLLPF